MAERRRAKRDWDGNAGDRSLAMTPGGSKVHRPTCSLITGTVRVADACLRGDKSMGNVPHPRWVEGERPTCQHCRRAA